MTCMYSSGLELFTQETSKKEYSQSKQNNGEPEKARWAFQPLFSEYNDGMLFLMKT